MGSISCFTFPQKKHNRQTKLPDLRFLYSEFRTHMIFSTALMPICRKTNPDFRFEVVEAFELLPRPIKELVARKRGIFGTEQYYLSLEKMGAKAPKNLYAQAFDGERCCGVFHFQLVPFSGNQLESFIPERLGTSFQKAIKRILNGFKSKLMVAGNIFMTGDTGICTFEDESSAHIGEIYAACVVNLLRERHKPGAFLVSDLYGPDTDFDFVLENAGFRRTDSEPDMELEIRPEWQSMDDYLNALSTKYRTRAKRTFSKSAEMEKKSLSCDEIQGCEHKLFELYSQVTEGVKLKLATLEHGYFSTQKKAEPERYHVFCYSKGGKPLGLMTYYINGQRLEVHHTGRDKESTTDMMLYERMLLDAVAFGIENKVQSIHFGRTATEVKSTIGARPREMHGYVFHTKPIRNQLFAFMARTLRAKPYQLRQPFKNQEIK